MSSPNEEISEKENNSKSQKPKTSKPAIASLILGCFTLLVVVLIIPSLDIGGIIAAIGLAYGIIALHRIEKSGGMLVGRMPAIIGIVINAVIVFMAVLTFIFPPGIPREKAYQMICGTNISGIGKAMMLYADDNNDMYPTADKWCDLLIQYCDMTPRQFVCRGSDVIDGESSYAFNKYLVGKKLTKVPDDIVLLFETNFGKEPEGRKELLGSRDFYNFAESSNDQYFHDYIKRYPESQKVYKLRWNQVGGPEILTTENHDGKGCNVLFNDMHVNFVKTEELGRLKWKAEEAK